MTSDRATAARRLVEELLEQIEHHQFSSECESHDCYAEQLNTIEAFAAEAEARGRAEGTLKPERITIETATMRVEQRPIPPDIQRDIEAALRQGRSEQPARLSPEDQAIVAQMRVIIDMAGTHQPPCEVSLCTSCEFRERALFLLTRLTGGPTP